MGYSLPACSKGPVRVSGGESAVKQPHHLADGSFGCGQHRTARGVADRFRRACKTELGESDCAAVRETAGSLGREPVVLSALAALESGECALCQLGLDDDSIWKLRGH